jgi:hypothetical protein
MEKVYYPNKKILDDLRAKKSTEKKIVEYPTIPRIGYRQTIFK